MMDGPAGTVRRIQVRREWIRRAFYAAGVVLLATPLLIFDYVRLREVSHEKDRLDQETTAQREELETYAARMQNVSDRLAKVGRLDRKLRIITDLDPEDPLPLPGIGGPEGEGIEPVRVAALTRRQRKRHMIEGLDRLEEVADAQGQRLEELIAHLEARTARLSATPSIAPTRGWITSDFGYRSSPFTGTREFHRGLDIAGRISTPILAPAEGKVRYVGEHQALGQTVILRHGYGLETVYGHLSEIEVKAGQKIKRGEILGRMGNTGRSTGPHLHYQVQANGVPVNPRNYILD
jgi:murein DD-endopeptidase MepM/ murein hydrolase activator NlpD